jgi:hypothetical protein
MTYVFGRAPTDRKALPRLQPRPANFCHGRSNVIPLQESRFLPREVDVPVCSLDLRQEGNSRTHFRPLIWSSAISKQVHLRIVLFPLTVRRSERDANHSPWSSAIISLLVLFIRTDALSNLECVSVPWWDLWCAKNRWGRRKADLAYFSLSSSTLHAAVLLIWFSTLKIEVILSSETSVHIQTTQHYVPEDGNITTVVRTSNPTYFPRVWGKREIQQLTIN